MKKYFVFLVTGPALTVSCDHFEDDGQSLIFKDGQDIKVASFTKTGLLGWAKVDQGKESEATQ